MELYFIRAPDTGEAQKVMMRLGRIAKIFMEKSPQAQQTCKTSWLALCHHPGGDALI